VSSWEETIIEQETQKVILQKEGLAQTQPKRRDSWDDEYDRGKTKKVKTQRVKKSSSNNLFQNYTPQPHKKFHDIGKKTKRK